MPWTEVRASKRVWEEREGDEGERGRRGGGGRGRKGEEEGEGRRERGRREAELVSHVNALNQPSNPLGDEHYRPCLLLHFALKIFECSLSNLSPPREGGAGHTKSSNQG